jgi:hypothetical protein
MNTRKVSVLGAHMVDVPSYAEKFDTLVSPSGTVATLNEIARGMGVDSFGYDYAFPTPETVSSALFDRIENVLQQGMVPVVAATALVYNVQKTLQEAAKIKSAFADRVKFVLGGQLVPFAREAYLRDPNIDIVAEGDAEILLSRIVGDICVERVKPFYSGWLKDSGMEGQFAFVNYDYYFMLAERLQAQRDVSGFSQLTIQGLGGPGCSWAAGNPNGACEFCALQNITTMNNRTLDNQMIVERWLQDRFSVDRFFDVANQFLPRFRMRDNVTWLQDYIRVRNEHGVTVSKYAYLTVASVNDEIADLLSQAGVTEVYLGVDHFDELALKEQNKSSKSQRVLEKALNALSSAGINMRMGLVVGSSRESRQSLDALRDGVSWLRDNYADRIKALGVFPIYVLPGSKVWDTAKKMPEAAVIISGFEEKGFLTNEEEAELSRIFMRDHSEASVEEIEEAISDLQAKVANFAISYDFRKSPDGSVLKV